VITAFERFGRTPFRQSPVASVAVQSDLVNALASIDSEFPTPRVSHSCQLKENRPSHERSNGATLRDFHPISSWVHFRGISPLSRFPHEERPGWEGDPHAARSGRLPPQEGFQRALLKTPLLSPNNA
jgi:hypothetical protein